MPCQPACLCQPTAHQSCCRCSGAQAPRRCCCMVSPVRYNNHRHAGSIAWSSGQDRADHKEWLRKLWCSMQRLAGGCGGSSLQEATICSSRDAGCSSDTPQSAAAYRIAAVLEQALCVAASSRISIHKQHAQAAWEAWPFAEAGAAFDAHCCCSHAVCWVGDWISNWNLGQFQATAAGAGAVWHWAEVNSLNSALCAGEVLRARSSFLILCVQAVKAQHRVKSRSDQASRGAIGRTRLRARQQQQAGALA